MDTSKIKLFTLPLTPYEREQCYWLVSTTGNRKDQLRAGKALLDALVLIQVPYNGDVSFAMMKHHYANAVSDIFNNWKMQFFNLCSLDFLNKLNFEVRDTTDEQKWEIYFNPFTKKLLSGELDFIIYPKYYASIPDELLLSKATKIVHSSSETPIRTLPQFPLNKSELTESQNALVNAWITQIETIFNDIHK